MGNRFYILLVDRNEKDLAKLKVILEEAGYEVAVATDGDKAVDIIEKRVPDMILSEINLPKVDGWELCWIVRERADLPDIPFVFLTSKGGVSDEVFCFDLGADDFIKKPYIKNELLARIKGLLTRLERVRQLTPPGFGGVKGRLKDMSLSDILQILSLGKRTAAIHVSRGDDRGSVFVSGGRVTHARYGEVKGEEALFQILSWDKGTFVIETGASTSVKSIDMSTERIILEGYKRLDEGSQRGAMPYPDTMDEGDSLILKRLFDMGIIEENGREEK